MIEQDPRVTEGPTFFQSLYAWMKRVAVEVNAKTTLAAVSAAMPSIATSAGFAFSLGAAGYVKFPSWLGAWIIQWGAGVGGTGGDTSVSFPLAFPTYLSSVVVTHVNGGGSGALFAAVGAVSLSAFNFSVWNLANARETAAVYWIAIGH